MTLTAAQYRQIKFKPIAISLAMILAAMLAIVLKPTQKMAEMQAQIDLETMIPKQIGQWRLDDTIVSILVSPDLQEKLNKIYTQLLSRTYINDQNGNRIMLSIAYGKDQRSDMAVHYPEFCYPAQGYNIKSINEGFINTKHHIIRVRRLETNKAQRHEPVTYWTTIGDYLSLGGLEKRLIELRYGLRHEIPDGLLFRVSSINEDSDKAFAEQNKFVETLFLNLSPQQRYRLVGKPTYLFTAAKD